MVDIFINYIKDLVFQYIYDHEDLDFFFFFLFSKFRNKNFEKDRFMYFKIWKGCYHNLIVMEDIIPYFLEIWKGVIPYDIKNAIYHIDFSVFK